MILSKVWKGLFHVGVNTKTEKLIKPRKPEKNNLKSRTVKQNRLKFWKNRPVWFRFYKLETKPNPNRKKSKNKPSQIGKKPSQTKKTEPNRFEPVFVLKNQTEPNPVGLNRFQFFLKLIWLFFLIKIKPNKK
jgi:hypothetical protein